MKYKPRYNQDSLEIDLRLNYGREFQRCNVSVMDTIADMDITFDENGVCNYFHEYRVAEAGLPESDTAALELFDKSVEVMKNDHRKDRYDCILGVSGGVDSTYLAYLAKQAGLRVLCVHFDNGWNSELAVRNIQQITDVLGFDLYTYVIDWEEFRDIQRSYFKANVIDIEAVTDIAIFSALDMICRKHKVQHILDGRNVVTEHTLPPSWICKNHSNLRDIQSRFGTRQLSSYPILSPLRRRILAKTKPFTYHQLLNFVNYRKIEAKEIIQRELDWKDYGGKHYESVFTRFYQGFILPEKFAVDKRKAHLSNLIFSGQINRETALEELKKPFYPSRELLEQDYHFALKKLGFTEEEFIAYLHQEGISHSNYAMSLSIFDEYPALRPFKFIKGRT